MEHYPFFETFSPAKFDRAFKIFVAGVPSNILLGRVFEYFQTLGYFDKIEGLNKREKYGDPNSNPLTQSCVRGCCILTTYDYELYKAIIDGKINPQLLNRRLICKVYCEGSQLADENRKSNSRRLLVKKVKGQISLQELSSFLEELGGPLEVIFPLRMHRKIRKRTLFEQDTNKNITYSVTFADQHAAERLGKLGSAIGPRGHEIFFLPFRFIASEVKQKMKESSNPQKETLGNPRKTRKGIKGTNQPPTHLSVPSRASQHSSNLSSLCSEDAANKLLKNQKEIEGTNLNRVQTLEGHALPYEEDEFIPILFSIRPTTRLYYARRHGRATKHSISDGPTLDLLPTPMYKGIEEKITDSSNLRFNLNSISTS